MIPPKDGCLQRRERKPAPFRQSRVGVQHALRKSLMPSNAVVNTQQKPCFCRCSVLPLQALLHGNDVGRARVGWCAGKSCMMVVLLAWSFPVWSGHSRSKRVGWLRLMPKKGSTFPTCHKRPLSSKPARTTGGSSPCPSCPILDLWKVVAAAKESLRHGDTLHTDGFRDKCHSSVSLRVTPLSFAMPHGQPTHGRSRPLLPRQQHKFHRTVRIIFFWKNRKNTIWRRHIGFEKMPGPRSKEHFDGVVQRAPVAWPHEYPLKPMAMVSATIIRRTHHLWELA